MERAESSPKAGTEQSGISFDDVVQGALRAKQRRRTPPRLLREEIPGPQKTRGSFLFPARLLSA